MMSKRHLMSALLVCSLVLAHAQTKVERWLDPQVNRVNTVQNHSSFFAYETQDLARQGEKEKSARFMTLEGKWRFHFVQNHNEAPAGFYAPKYDDSQWEEFPVPGLFEMNGHGDKIYKNVGYAWARQFASNPPKPIGSSRRGSKPFTTAR